MSLWYTRSGLSPTIWCDSCDAIDYSPISSVLPTPARCRKCGYEGLKAANAEGRAVTASVRAPESTISRGQYEQLQTAANELLNTIHKGNLYSAPLPRRFWDALDNLRAALEVK